MTETLDNVVLVDDSAPDNYVHRLMMKRAGFARNISDFEYAEDALDYLGSTARPEVDLVIVDINMPRMDGYEFADAYHKLVADQKIDAPIYILTSSIDPSDEERANQHPGIAGFLSKPLEMDALFDIFFRRRAAA